MSRKIKGIESILSEDERKEIEHVEPARAKFEKEVFRKLWAEAYNKIHDDQEGFHAMDAEPEKPPLGAENIVGFGLQEQIRSERYTGKLAITVYTQIKASPDKVKDECIMPPTFEGFPVNVVQFGLPEIHLAQALAPLSHVNPRQRFRPTKCGASIGHFSITAGTLGCLCATSKEDKLILSNNHVLAASNRGKKGDDEIQPGAADHGIRKDKVAELYDFVPIDFDGGDNHVDAALAKPTIPIEDVNSDILDIGTVRGIACDVGRHTPLQKSGRTTGHTKGILEGMNATFTINYREAGEALFRGLYVIKPTPPDPTFSSGGDSGSLILDNSNRAIALLFAGSPSQTLAIPICTVMESLGIDQIL